MNEAETTDVLELTVQQPARRGTSATPMHVTEEYLRIQEQKLELFFTPDKVCRGCGFCLPTYAYRCLCVRSNLESG